VVSFLVGRERFSLLNDVQAVSDSHTPSCAISNGISVLGGKVAAARTLDSPSSSDGHVPLMLKQRNI
jgi:hypothetical protein